MPCFRRQEQNRLCSRQGGNERGYRKGKLTMGKSRIDEGRTEEEQSMRFFHGPDYDSKKLGYRKSPVVLKMCQMITDRMGHKVNYDDPDYYGVITYCTDEMARVALAMGVRKDRSFDWIQKKTNKDPQRLQKVLDDLCFFGLVEYNWENPEHEKRYRVIIFVPGSAEQYNMHPEWMIDVDKLDENEKKFVLTKPKRVHPELAEAFNQLTQLPFTPTELPMDGITQLVPMGGAGTGMHVIPVEKAIEAENRSVSVEHLSHWLKKYDYFCIGPCTCRMSTSVRGCGCEDDWEWCIGVGDYARYVVETKKGREISYDEVIETLKKAEENGFVHQITNIDGENKIFGICNCDPKICYALRTSQLYNTPNMSASAYSARVDKENCVACGRCEEVCPAGAVKLGQKLCLKNGQERQYPKAEDPANTVWGKDKWNYNYRDDNRINTYDTGTAPCKTACPAHIAIQGYLKLARQGKYMEALRLIKRENPFPAVCGRVCNHKCEEACTRATVDQAIAIEAIKRFVADQDLKAETRYIPEVVLPSIERDSYPEKIAIFGAGPAGLSCAYYLATKGYKPTVFEKNEKPGGMLVYGIPSFKLEKKIVEAEIDVLRELGVDIRCGVEVGKDVTIEGLKKEGYKAFYVAIGCQGSRKANIPGEDAEGVMSAVDFLREVGGAITEDGEKSTYEVKGDVVVIGGGNVAIDVARSAVRCGAGKVSMYCLESRDIMPAADDEVADAEADGITVNCGWGPKEVLTDESGRVKGIVLKRCVKVFDDQHRFNPVYDENDTVTVDCSHVYTSIGQSIVWGDMLKGTAAKTGRGNGILVDSFTYQSDDECIFAGGDVVTGPKFAIDAIAAGHQAAESIHLYVRPYASSLTIGRDKRFFKELDKDNISLPEYDKTPRQVGGVDTTIDKKSFRDASLTFTEEQVKKETARCLSCGASVVDEGKCIGCGLCTTRCEFDAIHLHLTHPERSKMVPCEDRMKEVGKYAAARAVKIVTKRK